MIVLQKLEQSALENCISGFGAAIASLETTAAMYFLDAIDRKAGAEWFVRLDDEKEYRDISSHQERERALQ